MHPTDPISPKIYRYGSVLISQVDVSLMVFFVLQDDPLQDLDSLLELDDEGEFAEDGQVFDVGVGEEEALFLVHLLRVEKGGGCESPHLEHHLMRSEGENGLGKMVFNCKRFKGDGKDG